MRERKPDPPPLQTNDVWVVALGTAIWAVLFFVLLPFSATLRRDGHLWWLGACACGVALGLLGLRTARRRAAALTREKQAAEPATTEPADTA